MIIKLLDPLVEKIEVIENISSEIKKFKNDLCSFHRI